MGGQKTLWLVGMMGAGKSAVGRALAARLRLEFVNSDAEIVADSGRSIAEQGMAGFLAQSGTVVAAAVAAELAVG